MTRLHLDTRLRRLPLAVIDTETTGVDHDDRIVEIAVVHMTLGEPGAKVAYSARVKAPVPMSPGASKVTGITDVDLAKEPAFAAIRDDLQLALIGRAPVAYNAPFDHRMLLKEGVDLGWPWIDPMVAVKVLDKYGAKSLAEVCAERAIVVDAHGAAGDAVATALITTDLLRAAFGGCRTLGALYEQTERAAIASEAGFCRWALGKRKTKRPDCPWHELAGRALPEWPEPVAWSFCGSCGGRVRWSVAKDGSVEQVDADGVHRCGRAA